MLVGHLTGIIILQKVTFSSSFLNYWYGNMQWAYYSWLIDYVSNSVLLVICAGTYIKVDDRICKQQDSYYMCRYILIACCCLLFVCLLLPLIGNGEEEKSALIWILSVCRVFRAGLFTGGLFSCLVCVNCTDIRVSFPSFWRLLFVIVGTRGST